MAVGFIEYYASETVGVIILLSIDGNVVLSSRNPVSIARVATLMHLEVLQFAEGFHFTLPANEKLLRDAEQGYFAHRQDSLRIITALIWLADSGTNLHTSNRRGPRIRLKGLARRRDLGVASLR